MSVGVKYLYNRFRRNVVFARRKLPLRVRGVVFFLGFSLGPDPGPDLHRQPSSRNLHFEIVYIISGLITRARVNLKRLVIDITRVC